MAFEFLDADALLLCATRASKYWRTAATELARTSITLKADIAAKRARLNFKIRHGAYRRLTPDDLAMQSIMSKDNEADE